MQQGIPSGAQTFALRPHSKLPQGGRAHLDAIDALEFFAEDYSGNYGIRLDPAYIVVDIDRPDDPVASEWAGRLPDTWTQKTTRGTHRLYKLPEGTDLSTLRNSKFPAGDIKVRGYIVGPGSEVDGFRYRLLDEREPTEAPDWLVLTCSKEREPGVLVNGELAVEERDTIPIGQNDTELYSLACNFRRRGFSQEAIERMLRAIVKCGVVEQIEGNEYTDKDIKRLARQAARYNPEGALGPITEWVSAADIRKVGPPIRWWVRGFVPRGELVMMYGKGGVGKSSVASWLAAEVTKKGGRFVFVGVEEPFVRFAVRAILGGADETKLFAVPNATSLVLPRDADFLKDKIELSQTDCIYFDSIYSHFEIVPGMNTAERARLCLGPLAEIAQSTGCTVVAVFHENKAGDYLGSVEMVNVARYVLKATRNPNKPLYISVDKTNIFDPQKAMTFDATDTEFRDPDTGEVQLEEVEDGSLEPMMIKVLRRGDDVDNNAVDVDSIDGGKEVENYPSTIYIERGTSAENLP